MRSAPASTTRSPFNSARLGDSKDGLYGDADAGRSMDIIASDEALEEQSHPLVRSHAETGRLGIFGAPLSYIVGFEGVDPEEATALLKHLHAWQTRRETRSRARSWSGAKG